PVLSFVRDCLEFDPASAITTTDLHHEFNNYIVDSGRKPWAERTISARFSGHSEITSNGVRKALSEGLSISRVDPLEPVPSGTVGHIESEGRSPGETYLSYEVQL